MGKNFLLVIVFALLLCSCGNDKNQLSKIEKTKGIDKNDSGGELSSQSRNDIEVNYALFEERVVSGKINSGYSTSKKFVKRKLNTDVSHFGNNIKLDEKTNVITLLPGKYWISASAPAYSVTSHQIRIRNITDNVTSLLGTSEYSIVTGIQTRSFAEGVIKVNKETQIELQHFLNNCQTKCSYGINADSGEMDVFARIYIKEMR